MDVSPQLPDSEEIDAPDPAIVAPVASDPAAGLVGTAALIMLGTFLSSVLGLVRLLITNALFGQTAASGAYFAALKLPQTLADLLVGGAVSAALIPTFVEHALPDRHAILTRSVTTLIAAASLALAAVAIALLILAPWLVPALNPGFAPPARSLTVQLVRILAFGLPLTGVVGVLSALLAALRRQYVPALAAVLLHSGVITTTLLLGARLGVVSLALGLVLGTAAQVVFLWLGCWRVLRSHLSPSLKPSLPRRQRREMTRDQHEITRWMVFRSGFRVISSYFASFRVSVLSVFSVHSVVAILRLYAPVALGMAVQVVLTNVDQWLQSQTVDPATGLVGGPNVAAMTSATALIQFPVGLVAAALAFAALPDLARAAGDAARFAAVARQALRLGIFLMAPVTAIFFAAGEPVVALLFQHHAFTAVDTARTTLALHGFALELPAVAVELVTVAAFYARKQTLIPLLANLAGIGGYCALALPLFRTAGMPALAAANAVQHGTTAVVLLVALGIQARGVWQAEMLGTVGRALVAALVAGGVALRLNGFSRSTLGEQAIAAAVPALAGFAAYLAVTWALKAPELTLLARVAVGFRR